MRALLESVGFTFHQGTADDGAIAHWFCWCGPEGNWDVESGEYEMTQDLAIEAALARYIDFNEGVREGIRRHFDMIEHPMLDTYEPNPEEYEGGEDSPNYSEDATWCEAMRLCNEGGEDRALPPKPVDPVGIVRKALRESLVALDKACDEVAYGDEWASAAHGACTNALAALPYLTTIGERR